MSRWIEFVKQWAKDNNTTYGCAMSDPKLKEAYYKKHPKQSKEQKKEQKNKEQKDLEDKVRLGSAIRFKKQYIMPYLKEKNEERKAVLLLDMVQKYKKFSPELKELIKEKYPKTHDVINQRIKK